MITRISGKIIDQLNNSLFIHVGGFCYEVLVPPAIMQAVPSLYDEENNITLKTYHYYQNEPSRSVPVLIGFMNDLEKEFFELFITVSGIGPKAAVRALAVPISSIVEAIDNADYGLLQSLPGIGKQRAREIVAKLQGKVSKFGLIKKNPPQNISLKTKEEFREEALAVLLQLQYNLKEAKEMIIKAMENDNTISNVEQLLNEIYKQKKGHAR